MRDDHMETAVQEGVVSVSDALGTSASVAAGERVVCSANARQQFVVGTVVSRLAGQHKANLVLQTDHGERTFVPEWHGHGLDPVMVEKLDALSPGDRVEVRWAHDGEHPRLLAIEVQH